ncbi:multidrug resistance-associated ABC transporter [Ephemerocybe angulata]|uniref:Multidrug resistance-associated ABC transporter n=1 Tax=Ephemerocybe angulata TaxID=980116 RepID=A0A8H6M140_9AGAR|nr:multidrug resistance-associated ABC transporter [Tulosesus angulatus]
MSDRYTYIQERFGGSWPPVWQTDWDDNGLFYFPSIVALLSIVPLSWRFVKLYRAKKQASTLPEALEVSPREVQACQNLVSRYGGKSGLLFTVARVLCCCALVGLSAFSIPSTDLLSPFGGPFSSTYTALLIANTYALFLAGAAVIYSTWRKLLLQINVSVLLVELGVYVYRDVWPLARYGGEPRDLTDSLLWARFILLTLAALVIPLVVPTVYKPLNPKDTADRLHPEQTASLLSTLTFTYLSPTITVANRASHLNAEALPPMADYDRARFLADRAIPYVDTQKIREARHIAFPLLRMFGLDLFAAVASMTVHTLLQFAAPLSVNRLLIILQSGQEQTTGIKPWFWLACMFTAPILGSMGFNSSVSIMNAAFARIESILAQLVFDHSLRIRIQAESSPEADESAELNSDKEEDTANFIGKLNNLITVDLANVTGSRDFILLFYTIPLQMIGCTVFLYALLGWSAFVGLSTLVVLLFTVPGYLTAKLQDLQAEKLKKTDSRTQTVIEAMSILRMVKLFGWERKIQEKIDVRRDKELKWAWKVKIIPTLAMLASYSIATLVMKIQLTSAIVFSSMMLFDMMRDELGRGSMILSFFITGKVSLDRFNTFFKTTDLLDSYSKSGEGSGLSNDRLAEVHTQPEDNVIGFKNASFTWVPELSPGARASYSQFKLTVPGELYFVKGKINLIVGPTGSGKTSLLMALLGEMHFTPTQLDSSFNLPRAGGVAFAVQESWVQNETVRDNIIFHSAYDEDRYRKVLYQCALEQDLELFEAGDQTEVGERGLTLRAIYSRAEVILLDDVLAALDVHTSKWVVSKCLQGDLVQGRTVLLVTHNIALAGPIADFIISVTPDGVVTSREQDVSAALAAERRMDPENTYGNVDADMPIEPHQEQLNGAGTDKNKKSNGKLVVAEEIQHGNVSWDALRLLLKSAAGDRTLLFFSIWTIALFFEAFLYSFATWFLWYWSSQYEYAPLGSVHAVWYMGVFSGILALALSTYTFSDLYLMLGVMRASQAIHKLLCGSIFGATLRWLDETPVSRITTRVTQDIRSVDGPLWFFGQAFAAQIVIMLISFVSAVLFAPVFALPGILIAFAGIYIGRRYLKAQLSVKRELSNAKAPVVAHFGAAIAGIVSIRAYGVQSSFKDVSQKRIDNYTMLCRINNDLNRWIGIRIDTLGALFTASLATYLTYSHAVSAANVGFSLNRAVEFCTMMLWVIRVFNAFQVEANSMERIFAYTKIEQEETPSEGGRPPAAWPTSGEVRVENLSARYSKTGPVILHDLNFAIRSGERIGVVGRTGSGKSSLTLALLRCILTEGTVYFDGLATDKINLDALRSNITIIPQMVLIAARAFDRLPHIKTGTLRYNLDPFGEYDDATLNAALQSSGFYASDTDAGEGRLNLDSTIAGVGANISVGQRQIVALARAIIRSSKVLILDEDHETDVIIQNTLRRELGADVSVLTIAHRLQTIMDVERVMVLDAGRIVEFASPKELLAQTTGIFKSLVDESADKERMYALAGVGGNEVASGKA